MYTSKLLIRIITLITFLLLNATPVCSEDELSSEIKDPDLEQEFKWLKAETFVITASKVLENIKKAPASITVITDKQIRQMGARHLADVIRTVPGMQPWYHFSGTNIFNIRRGAGGGGSSDKILIMLNNHSLNTVRMGGATWVYDTLALDNVKRIEVIRGPGSALYGANAFWGVINVITKEAEDIDGVELTASGGSYDTQQYNLLYGNTFADLEVVFNFNYFKTHGFRGLIEEDNQTQFDQIWGAFGFPPASLAPGRMDADDEKYDARLTLKHKGFIFDGIYIEREQDFSVGWVAALNNKSIDTTSNYALNLSYERRILEGLDLTGKVYSNLEDLSIDLQMFPPGYVTQTPTGLQIMQDGMILKGSVKTRRIGVEIQAIYRINDSNTVVTGVTYERLKQYDTSNSANYEPIPNPPFVITPLASVQKWSDIYTEDTEKVDFKAVFLEDIWDITDNLRITTGVRYDSYSNFGGEASPRVGLTWEYIEGYDLKLLYGHAFRAPSFNQLYSKEFGNPDLEPEENDTYEISLGADFSSSLSARITGTYIETKNVILSNPLPPFQWINYGKARRHGFEVDVKYDFGRGMYVAGNYNYGSTPVGSTPAGKSRNWTSPRHLGNIMANIRLSRYLTFFTNCHFEDGFPREFGDNRDDMSGYAIVDATLIARKFLKGYEGLELRASVYNLLDKEYTSPQDPRLPNDLPMPGINFLVEMKYEF